VPRLRLALLVAGLSLLDGLELYTRGGAHFDTYGPLTYLLYIPFVLIWPFHESQTYPPAAEAAGIVWELLTVGGLVVLGRQTRLGWTLALAWAACPFTALAVVCGSNDGLVAALPVWAFVAFRSPPLRGLLAGARPPPNSRQASCCRCSRVAPGGWTGGAPQSAWPRP
jgi:hypothetical protein